MALILLNNFGLGGIADSKYLGLANSNAALVGFDLHSEPGILKVNQKLTNDSGATFDDFVKAIVPCSDGNTYFFGATTGKIWKRTSGGVYSLEATAAPAAGAAGILDAREYQGYIYYSMQSKLGRWQLSTAWSSRNDSWASFSNTDIDFHPMIEQNLVMYIGDRNYLAQVDGVTFSNGSTILDIKNPLRMRSLGRVLTDILVGTYVTDNVTATEIFRWNTWSLSFTNSDEIPETGINAFLSTDNSVIVNAGRKGNLYSYNGMQLDQFKQIPGTWSGTNQAIVHSNAVANLYGLPLFGLSNISGNPAPQGVYSYGSRDRNYTKVLNLEYVISTGNTSNIEIGAMVISGDNMFVSWKDTNTGTVYGVDRLDASNKYSCAYFETRVINIERSSQKELNVVVNYRTLPTGTGINIYASVNYGSYTLLTSINDIDRLCKYAKERISGANTVQIKVELTASGNNAPELESVEIDILPGEA